MLPRVRKDGRFARVLLSLALIASLAASCDTGARDWGCDPAKSPALAISAKRFAML
jgi:hypothetical protein